MISESLESWQCGPAAPRGAGQQDSAPDRAWRGCGPQGEHRQHPGLENLGPEHP